MPTRLQRRLPRPDGLTPREGKRNLGEYHIYLDCGIYH